MSVERSFARVKSERGSPNLAWSIESMMQQRVLTVLSRLLPPQRPVSKPVAVLLAEVLRAPPELLLTGKEVRAKVPDQHLVPDANMALTVLGAVSEFQERKLLVPHLTPD